MTDMRRILRVQRLLAELGHADVIEALEELKRLRAALDKIAERTNSDDPCRGLVQIARKALTPNLLLLDTMSNNT